MTKAEAIKRADEMARVKGITYAVVAWKKRFTVMTKFSAKFNGMKIFYSTDQKKGGEK